MVELIEIGAGGGSHRTRRQPGPAQGRPGQRGRRPGPGLLRARRHRSRPSPTPTCCSATSTPTSFWVGDCGSTATRPQQAIGQRIGEPLGDERGARRVGHPPARQRGHGQCRARARHRTRQGSAQPAAVCLRRRRTRRMASASRGCSHSPRLIVPFGAGVTSAFGFLTAPLAFDFVRSFVAQLDTVDWQHVNAILDEMARPGRGHPGAFGRAREPNASTRARPTCATRARGTRSASSYRPGTLGPTAWRPMRETFEAVVPLAFWPHGSGRRAGSSQLARDRLGPATSSSSAAPRPAPRRMRARASASSTSPSGSEHRPTPVYDRYALGPGPASTDRRSSRSASRPPSSAPARASTSTPRAT